MGVITYCDDCGVLMRSSGIEGRVVCPDCRTGVRTRPRPTRDSGRIPYSQSPTPESVLEAIQSTVRSASRRATPCS